LTEEEIDYLNQYYEEEFNEENPEHIPEKTADTLHVECKMCNKMIKKVNR
jgi:hypothetical protein